MATGSVARRAFLVSMVTFVVAMVTAAEAEKKTVLLVFAHWEAKSYNAAIKDRTVETLEGQGHKVIVSDLYAMNFNPVLGRHDVVGDLKDPSFFSYIRETSSALHEGRLADDIQSEQEKVREADLIIFQFPFSWMGPPAIMKGWLDRVFSHEFAFRVPDGLFDNGYMKGKQALLSFTAGGSAGSYTGTASMGDMDVNLFPLHNGIFRFCGFDVLAPQIFYSMDASSYEKRTQLLDDWAKRLETLFEEQVLFFIPSKDMTLVDPEDPMSGEKLTDEADEKFGKSPYAPNAGQHLGKPLAPRELNPKIKYADKDEL